MKTEHPLSITFPDAYQEELLRLQPTANLAELTNVQYAPLEDQPGETMPYVVLTGNKGVAIDTGNARPVFCVLGFTEGIEAKAPMALELAARGHTVIMPDQNRAGMLYNTDGKKDATLTQAVNNLAVLENMELAFVPGSVDVLTHSYGALVFETMLALAQERGYRCFEDAEVVMTTPAGFNDRENSVALNARFVGMLVSELFSAKEFVDVGSHGRKAGLRRMFANIPRSWREGRELATRRIDTARLLESNIGRLSIVSSGEDLLFTNKTLEPMVSTAIAHEIDGKYKATWLTPTSTTELIQRNGQMRIRGRRGATHNDDHFNPRRNGGAVDQVLRLGHARRSGQTFTATPIPLAARKLVWQRSTN